MTVSLLSFCFFLFLAQTSFITSVCFCVCFCVRVCVVPVHRQPQDNSLALDATIVRLLKRAHPEAMPVADLLAQTHARFVSQV